MRETREAGGGPERRPPSSASTAYHTLHETPAVTPVMEPQPASTAPAEPLVLRPQGAAALPEGPGRPPAGRGTAPSPAPAAQAPARASRPPSPSASTAGPAPSVVAARGILVNRSDPSKTGPAPGGASDAPAPAAGARRLKFQMIAPGDDDGGDSDDDDRPHRSRPSKSRNKVQKSGASKAAGVIGGMFQSFRSKIGGHGAHGGADHASSHGGAGVSNSQAASAATSAATNARSLAASRIKSVAGTRFGGRTAAHGEEPEEQVPPDLEQEAEVAEAKRLFIDFWLEDLDPLSGLGPYDARAGTGVGAGAGPGPGTVAGEGEMGLRDVTEAGGQPREKGDEAERAPLYTDLRDLASAFSPEVLGISDEPPADEGNVPSYPTSRRSSLDLPKPRKAPIATALQEIFLRKKEEEKQRTINRLLSRMGLSVRDEQHKTPIREGDMAPVPEDEGRHLTATGSLERRAFPMAKLVSLRGARVWEWVWVKEKVQRLVFHPDFEMTVILLIVGNCLTLALYRPREKEDSRWNGDLQKADVTLNAFFTLELFMRMIADDTLKTYAKNPWNIFDCAMVILGWTVFIPSGSGSNNESIKTMRALRALRPLRSITRVESLRAIVVCFLEAIPLLVSVIGLFLFLLIMFSITAMQIFMPAYHKECVFVDEATGKAQVPLDGPNYDPNASYPGEFGCGGWRKCPEGQVCVRGSRGRADYVPGYDNLINAALTTFQVITLSDWTYIMYRTVDATGWYVVLYFIPVVLIGSLFMLNLFLAVLKSKFGQAQNLYKQVVNNRKLLQKKGRAVGQVSIATRAAEGIKNFINRRRTQDAVNRLGAETLESATAKSTATGLDEEGREVPWYLAKPPDNANSWVRFRFRLAKVVHSPWFENFYLVLIVLNTIALAIEYHNMPKSMRNGLANANIAFTSLFALEIVLKILGMSLWEYVSDGFNLFDFLIVFISLLELGLSSSGRLSALRAFRAVRVVRAIRFFRVIKSLRKITDVIGQIMSSFISVAALMSLFVFVYTVIGLHAFGTEDQVNESGEIVDFSTFLGSLTVVFQVLTVENWEIAMWAVSDRTSRGSIFFFLTWILLGKFILLTLFLANILEAFESKYDKDVAREALQIQKTLEKYRGAQAAGSKLVPSNEPDPSGSGLGAEHGHTGAGDGPPNPISPKGGLQTVNEEEDHRRLLQEQYQQRLQRDLEGYTPPPPQSSSAAAQGPKGLARSSSTAAGPRGPSLKSTASFGRSTTVQARSQQDRTPPKGPSLRQEASHGTTVSGAPSAPAPGGPLSPARRTGSESDEEDGNGMGNQDRKATANRLAMLMGGGSSIARAGGGTPLNRAGSGRISAPNPRPPPAPAAVPETQAVSHDSATPSAAPAAAAAISTVADPGPAAPTQPRATPQPSDAGGAPPRMGHSRIAPLPGLQRPPPGKTSSSGMRFAGLAEGVESIANAGLLPASLAPHGRGAMIHPLGVAAPSAYARADPSGPGPVSEGPSYADRLGGASGTGLLSHDGGAAAPGTLVTQQSLPIQGHAAGGPGGVPHHLSLGAGSGQPLDSGAGGAVAPTGTSSSLNRTPEGGKRPGMIAAASALRYSMAGGVRQSGPGGTSEGIHHSRFALPTQPSPGVSFDPPPATRRPYADDDTASVMTSTTNNSVNDVDDELMGNIKVALEAQFLMDGDLNDDAKSTTSNAGVEREIAMGVKEERRGKKGVAARKRAELKKKFNPNAPVPYTGVALWLFKPSNRFRQILYRLINKKKFDYFMFVVIVTNCCFMVYDNPRIEKGSRGYYVLRYSDLAFTIIFSIEATIKIVALGFIPYIRRASNFVDFLIVVISIILQALENANLSFLKGLRVLRAFKPVRMLTRSAGMQLVLRSLVLSLASIGNVTLLMFFLLTVFGILGVQLFGGQFYSCNDPSVPNRLACVGNFTAAGDTSPTERAWSNVEFNFDNLGEALQSLFLVMNLDSYLGIVYQAQSTRGLDKQPKYGANMAAIFYFISYIIIIVFCMLNLYVGVMFFEFTKIRMYSQTGSAFLTSEQQEWLEMVNMLARLKPKERPKNVRGSFRRFCLTLAESKWFDYFMLTVIMINMGFLASMHYDQPDSWTKVLGYSEYVFTVIFVCELFIKVIAMSFPLYIRNSWNKMDFVIVLASLMGAAVQIMDAMPHASLAQASTLREIQNILRVLRLLRMLRVIRSFAGMRSLLQTLVYSLPAFWNVGALLALLFFVYAYVGVIFFGKIQLGSNLNYHANFRDFGMAMITLFRVATIDSWTGLMEDCTARPPGCRASEGECGSLVAIPYFYSFILLVAIIMFNIFTAVVIENFEKQENRDGWRLEATHLEAFVDEWSRFDDGNGTVEHSQLKEIVLRVPPPLGLKGANATAKDVIKFLGGLDMTMDKTTGRLPFHRTLFELVKRVSAADIPEGLLKEQIDRTVAKIFKNNLFTEEVSFAVFLSVRKIQMTWRARMQERRIQNRLDSRKVRDFETLQANARRETILAGPGGPPPPPPVYKQGDEYLRALHVAIRQAEGKKEPLPGEKPGDKGKRTSGGSRDNSKKALLPAPTLAAGKPGQPLSAAPSKNGDKPKPTKTSSNGSEGAWAGGGARGSTGAGTFGDRFTSAIGDATSGARRSFLPRIERLATMGRNMPASLASLARKSGITRLMGGESGRKASAMGEELDVGVEVDPDWLVPLAAKGVKFRAPFVAASSYRRDPSGPEGNGPPHAPSAVHSSKRPLMASTMGG